MNGGNEILRLALTWITPAILLLVVGIRFVQLRRKRRRRRAEPAADATANLPVMRRRDRAVSEPSALDEIMGAAFTCRLAFAAANEPYLVPLNFGAADRAVDVAEYEADSCRFVVRPGQRWQLYFHAAGEGRKLDLMRLNPRVCFEIEGEARLAPGDCGCDWSTKYSSVIGYGNLVEVIDPDEKRRGLECIMRHAGATGDVSIPQKHIDSTTVLRLDVEEVTGKAN